jgi:Ran GTPase-activating protein (RanGAP) involved in mRNA processing and transport
MVKVVMRAEWNGDSQKMKRVKYSLLDAVDAIRRGRTQANIDEQVYTAVHVETLCAAIGGSTTLSSISMWECYMSDEVVAALAAAFALSTSLQTVNLPCNEIGDVGAVALADALATNTSLASLDVSGNDISPEGALALAAAVARSRSLTSFYCLSDVFSKDVQKTLHGAMDRAVYNRRLLAFQGAAIPGRKRSGTPAKAFVLRDGDTALGHRIAWFLLE